MPQEQIQFTTPTYDQHAWTVVERGSLGLARYGLVFPTEASTVRAAPNLHKPMATTCAVMDLPSL
jgi:hypothetical protein